MAQLFFEYHLTNPEHKFNLCQFWILDFFTWNPSTKPHSPNSIYPGINTQNNTQQYGEFFFSSFIKKKKNCTYNNGKLDLLCFGYLSLRTSRPILYFLRSNPLLPLGLQIYAWQATASSHNNLLQFCN
jgi:hypothetical protein